MVSWWVAVIAFFCGMVTGIFLLSIVSNKNGGNDA